MSDKPKQRTLAIRAARSKKLKLGGGDNPVAKHAFKFNKAKIEPDKKKRRIQEQRERELWDWHPIAAAELSDEDD